MSGYSASRGPRRRHRWPRRSGDEAPDLLPAVRVPLRRDGHGRGRAVRRAGAEPGHPTGQALCVKGKAAPEIVRHPDRLLHPLRRTRPKGAADPGWQRITWDEALDTVAARLRALARDHGPESVVFGSSLPVDLGDVGLRRLGARASGAPSAARTCASYMELCGWGRYLAPLYTFGAPVPGALHARPGRRRLHPVLGLQPVRRRGSSHATSTVAALRRGARLVVVDPRRAGLATQGAPLAACATRHRRRAGAVARRT